MYPPQYIALTHSRLRIPAGVDLLDRLDGHGRNLHQFPAQVGKVIGAFSMRTKAGFRDFAAFLTENCRPDRPAVTLGTEHRFLAIPLSVHVAVYLLSQNRSRHSHYR